VLSEPASQIVWACEIEERYWGRVLVQQAEECSNAS
jgi:hypothetical protein